MYVLLVTEPDLLERMRHALKINGFLSIGPVLGRPVPSLGHRGGTSFGVWWADGGGWFDGLQGR